MLLENLTRLDRKYQIILADPPWSFNNRNTGGSMSSGAAQKYNIMSTEDLKVLPIDRISADNCFLFLWWVASMPEIALEVVNSWGFKLKTMTAFSWIKQTKHKKDHFGMGFYTRQQQEHCLLAVKGKPLVLDHSVRQNIREENIRHSQKPHVTRERIISLCGDLPKIELFARQLTPGWDVWGEEIEDAK